MPFQNACLYICSQTQRMLKFNHSYRLTLLIYIPFEYLIRCSAMWHRKLAHFGRENYLIKDLSQGSCFTKWFFTSNHRDYYEVSLREYFWFKEDNHNIYFSLQISSLGNSKSFSSTFIISHMSFDKPAVVMPALKTNGNR